MHDFLIVRSENEVMKMRSICHVGNLMASPLSAVDPSQSCIPMHCYADHPRPLAAEKLAHVQQMYSRYVPPERWPRYLSSIPQTTSPTAASNPGPSRITLDSSTTKPHQPPAKKVKKCTTIGCDGSGHRNKKRWNEGHTTKADCPRDRR